MKKTTSKMKRQCKLCCEPVTNKTGLQCRGACKRWMHFKCLNFTPGKIQDIKKGIIQVNCPCPNCNTTVPREVLVDVPFICKDKSCPATKPPICNQPQCPSHFKSQDIKAPPPPLTPKPITTIRGCDIAAPCEQSLPDLPPEPPMKETCCGQKSPPANTPCKPEPESKCKPIAKEKPKTEPVKYKSQAAKPNCTEEAAPCCQSLPVLPPESPPVKDTCSGETCPVINPLGPSASENKNPAPPSPPCMNPISPSATAPATPPPLPKTSASYPKCCPSVGGQKGCSCGGNLKKTMSDCTISHQDEHILINALQNLCAVMGELSKQVKNLVGKLVNIIETG